MICKSNFPYYALFFYDTNHTMGVEFEDNGDNDMINQPLHSAKRLNHIKVHLTIITYPNSK